MENGAYFIRADAELVEVDYEVYLTYYRMRRQEKTLLEKDARHGVVSYDAWDNESGPGAGAIRDPAPPPEELVLGKLTKRKLKRCLQELPADERDLIHALFFTEKSIAALSRETGDAPRTLGCRRDAILKKLRRMMEN
ncbi:MAG: sigma-70 family RNA polymerase sigma factor [Oscillospiraceae bacterium]|jgi:DNA-directed RNA polymerase specialized sigma24 family protein|nr:sigma-70 family RNA polymerase sigma factor [Oscillospiraceae bacterium]